MSSVFPKTEAVERTIGKVSSAAGGSTSRVVLNKDSLVAEHALLISVAQSFTGAPTDLLPGHFIKALTVETDRGSIIRASGAALYELARLTEAAGKVSSTLGTSSSAQFLLDLHYENDGAIRDLATAIEADTYSTFDLVIEWADDSANGFIGGAGAGSASYSVEVVSRDLPDLMHVGEFEEGDHYGVAQFAHFIEEQVKKGSTAGSQEPVRLMTGCHTRFIGLIVEDMTGGSFQGRRDDIVTNVLLVIGGRERRKVSFNYLQAANARARGYDVAGVAFLDWGDDEIGFLDLENEAEAQLVFETDLPNGVTDWQVRVIQDYTR